MAKYRMKIGAFTTDVEVETNTAIEAAQLAIEKAIENNDWNYEIIDGVIYNVDKEYYIAI